MSKEMLTVDQVKDLIENNTEMKRCLLKNLQLVLLVDSNYEHIQQLESLILLFRNGLEPYYKEYHPNQDLLSIYCGLLAENTRSNHYHSPDKGEKKFDIYNAFAEFYPDQNLERYNFKQKWYNTL